MSASCLAGSMFQSTPPRGGRRHYQVDILYERIVSIHAPARGATIVTGKLPGDHRVSIHAPARGGHKKKGKGGKGDMVSIHAPARGATLLHLFVFPCGSFNPRPRAGATQLKAFCGARIEFQSTPRRGGRPPTSGRRCNMIQFQSTPPRGGRPRACGPLPVFLRFQSTPPRGGRPVFGR